MATVFDREVRPVDINQLQDELNASPDISATCMSIDHDDSVATGNNITIHWSTDLTTTEEAAMDAVIAAHIPRVEDVNVTELPYSYLGDKLNVHSSAKPAVKGKEFYLVWSGAGDDISNGIIGGGELLQFHMTPGVLKVTKIVEFDPQFGDAYIHEGYAKWEGGGYGDNITATIVARATQLQTSVNLDLIIDADNWVKYSPNGPGTGTHGFAADPILLKRSFSKDGDWDYDPVNGLTPNVAGTGEYKISAAEVDVHRYINRIPTFGNSYGFTRMTSEETAWLPPGYYIRIDVENASDGDWNLCVFMEVFRERTAMP